MDKTSQNRLSESPSDDRTRHVLAPNIYWTKFSFISHSWSLGWICCKKVKMFRRWRNLMKRCHISPHRLCVCVCVLIFVAKWGPPCPFHERDEDVLARPVQEENPLCPHNGPFTKITWRTFAPAQKHLVRGRLWREHVQAAFSIFWAEGEIQQDGGRTAQVSEAVPLPHQNPQVTGNVGGTGAEDRSVCVFCLIGRIGGVLDEVPSARKCLYFGN